MQENSGSPVEADPKNEREDGEAREVAHDFRQAGDA